MSQRSPNPFRPLAAALAGLSALLLAACGGDDPTCVFVTGGCQGGGAGSGAQGDPATLPVDFQTILVGKPTIQRIVPDGGALVSSTSPVVIVFSESMAPSVLNQIDLIALDVGGFPTGPVPVSRALVAGGRVLLLLPILLAPTGYIVQATSDAVLTDLQGQRADVVPGAQLASFQVNLADPDAPTVVDTFPAAGSARFPTTQEIVTVFDRPMDPTTVNSLSFVVEVGGVPPAFNPPPVPLTIDTGFVPIVDSRVFLYRSV
ncbi:MAG: Ig-like domain-containing protein, partial [Planctomycetota bacterium]|nr:Ig-like domain-containing protein [Planctomycetota bacterium]